MKDFIEENIIKRKYNIGMLCFVSIFNDAVEINMKIESKWNSKISIGFKKQEFSLVKDRWRTHQSWTAKSLNYKV